MALGRVALVALAARLENNPARRALLVAENERLRARVALLEELTRIKDARMLSISAAKRPHPHYAPEARLRILTLRAAAGWSVARTAQEFMLTPATVAAWMRRLDEDGPEALVRVPEPVNRFPDFVAALVHQLKATLPLMGKVRIAHVLARAGLAFSASTVKRLAERRLPLPEPPRPRAEVGRDARKTTERAVSAKCSHHVWHVDLTVVPTGAGFWIPWLPFSLPVVWPFCFWVAAAVDHYSRAVVAARSFSKEPSAADVCVLLDAAVERAGAAPRHIISDRGVQFGAEYRAWCASRSARPRFGALGQHGSIAIIERFWRSMKQECFRRLSLVPIAPAAFEAELAAYVRWYNELRPHRALHGNTPGEVRDGLVPASEQR